MITIIFNAFLFCFAFWLISPKLYKRLHQTQILATNHKNVPGQSLHIFPFWNTKSLRGELRHFFLCVGCSGLVCTYSPAKLVQTSLPRSGGDLLCSFACSLRPLRGVALPLLQSVCTGEGSALRWVNKMEECRGVGGGLGLAFSANSAVWCWKIIAHLSAVF